MASAKIRLAVRLDRHGCVRRSTPNWFPPRGRLIWRLALVVISGVLLVIGGPGMAADGINELIDLDLTRVEQFEPAVRKQVQLAYQEAQDKPRDAEPVGRLGMILQAYGKYALAELCYRRARALAPRAFRWAYYLANVQGWLGRQEEAIGYIRAALKISPGSVPAQLRLAQLLFEAGDLEASAAAYTPLTSAKYRLATAHFGLGQVRAARGDWAGAIESYRRACELAENYAAAHYGLGMAYRRTGQIENARQQLEQYEKVKARPQPSDDPLTAAVNALYAGGLAAIADGSELLRQGKLRQAAAKFEEALEVNPRLVMAHTNLIAVYGQLGDAPKAEQHYRAAIADGPGWVEAYHNWGMFQAGRGKTDKAIEAFSQAVRINPNYADSQAELGLLLEQKGRRREAVEHYRAAIEGNPAQRQAHYLLGRSLVRSGQFREGIEHLLKTIQVEDDKTPICMQTLAAAYAHAGERQNAIHYFELAGERAKALGNAALAADIQRELNRLTQQDSAR